MLVQEVSVKMHLASGALLYAERLESALAAAEREFAWLFPSSTRTSTGEPPSVSATAPMHAMPCTLQAYATDSETPLGRPQEVTATATLNSGNWVGGTVSFSQTVPQMLRFKVSRGLAAGAVALP